MLIVRLCCECWKWETLRQFFWTASFTRDNQENVFDPARIGLTSSQLSYEAELGAGHERFGILVDEDIVKVSLSMSFYGGKCGKDADNQTNLINLGKLEPSVEWNHS